MPLFTFTSSSLFLSSSSVLLSFFVSISAPTTLAWRSRGAARRRIRGGFASLPNARAHTHTRDSRGTDVRRDKIDDANATAVRRRLGAQFFGMEQRRRWSTHSSIAYSSRPLAAGQASSLLTSPADRTPV